jgi:hypothetical protein
MTSVPSNRLKTKLPVGMAIRFDEMSPVTEALLQINSKEHQDALEL